jgi:Cys-rich four helix bundle protein (predicted Tat secretion target)
MMQNIDKNESQAFSDDRRLLLKGAGALVATSLAATSLSGLAQAGSHEHGHMAAANKGNKALAAALHACVSASEACINHCQDMFKMGDTSLADCAITVQETMAFCAAHAKLANYDSKFLKEATALGMKMCAACEKECRKHEKHAECKACAESCADCIKACKISLS